MSSGADIEHRAVPPAPRAARAAAAAHTAPTGADTDAAFGGSEALALLTADDLAARWGVRRKAIYSLVETHGLPCVRLGRYLRFREASVKRWLDEREDGSNA